MIETELVTFISQVGFPIAITIYLLISRDKIITRNSEALEKLGDVVAELCRKS